MMNDLISRQAARTFEDRVCHDMACYRCPMTDDDGTCRIDDWLKALPSAEPEQRWIPCSERLPSEGQECFGTDEYGQIRHVFKDKCGESEFATVEEYMHIKIVAWMPLPEPYKGGE